jgi:hypothetical protein
MEIEVQRGRTVRKCNSWMLLIADLHFAHRQFLQPPLPKRRYLSLLSLTRRQVFERIKPLERRRSPFVKLTEKEAGRWGQGLTAEKMTECVWVKQQVVAEIEFLEWSVLQKCTDEGVNMT